MKISIMEIIPPSSLYRTARIYTIVRFPDSRVRAVSPFLEYRVYGIIVDCRGIVRSLVTHKRGAVRYTLSSLRYDSSRVAFGGRKGGNSVEAREATRGFRTGPRSHDHRPRRSSLSRRISPPPPRGAKSCTSAFR